MQIYHYAPQTAEYVGGSVADESPLEPGVYLIPARATTTPPPQTGENQVAVFDGNGWTIRSDYRGKTYYEKASGIEHKIIDIGVSPDSEWTDQAPAEDTVWDESSQSWVKDLAKTQEKTWRRLEADMHAYIFDTHDYPQPTQITLQAIYGDPDSNSVQRAACKEIFDWVKGSVLAYYYNKKAEILASEEPKSVIWDFADACDAGAPGYTLAQIIQMVG